MALLAVLSLLWGSSYLLIKIAVDSIPPVTLIAARVTVAALFLLAVMAWGQQYVESGLASVLNSTSPLFVFLITVMITRHEPTNPLKLLGACLGAIGVTLSSASMS